MTLTQQDAVTPAAPAPRWLDEQQQRHWRDFMIGSTVLRDVLERQLQADAGLSLGEYEVLVHLSEAPGRALRMSELAERLAHSRSRLSHTVSRMERAGLVERRRCDQDARGVWCGMTEHGWAVIQAAAPGHVTAVRAALVDVVSPAQLAALGEAMGVVRAALDQG